MQRRTDYRVSRPNRYIYKSTPRSKAQGTFWKRGWKECVRGPEVCSEIMSPRNYSKAKHHQVSTTWLPKQNLSNDNSSRHAVVDGEISWRPSYMKNHRHEGLPRQGELTGPQDEAPDGLSTSKCSALKSYT